MARPDQPPSGGIKWKALFDDANKQVNKVLIRNTHTHELLPWYGFSRAQGKDFVYTSIPVTDEQQNIISIIEQGVQGILLQYDWSMRFTVTPTQKIFPKTDNCCYYEKKEDGRLYRTFPKAEDELHHGDGKALSIGALLQITGVYFDFATNQAKLTFRMVCATYAWSEIATERAEVYSSYLSAFGEIIDSSAPALPPAMDILEASVMTSDIVPSIAIGLSSDEPSDKETFLNTLSKTRSVGGIQKRLKQLQRRSFDAGFNAWAANEAQKAILALTEKAKRKEKKEKKVKSVTFAQDEVTAEYSIPPPPPQHSMDTDILESASDSEDDEC